VGRWDGFDYFPPSKPLPARGGIKARSKRGAFGQNWWSRRWIAALERFHGGARLARGRSYARGGQVLDVQVETGMIRGKVQGSRVSPYQVTIEVKPLPAEARSRVVEAIASRAAFAAKLLAGEMPEDIEQAFAEAQAPLFPERAADLATRCSCPDWSNPCKHAAAVYYLVGEAFDRDPFLIFKLRGLDREALLGTLAAPSPEPAAERMPLPADPAAFWDGRPLGGWEPPPAGSPPIAAALLRVLGEFPFWRGERSLLDALTPAYEAAAVVAAGSAEPPAPVAPAKRMEPLEPVQRAPTSITAPVCRSRDRAAAEADILAGLPEAELRQKYDGRVLRGALRRAARAGEAAAGERT
jgi:uncharacterized Zn finger protein